MNIYIYIYIYITIYKYIQPSNVYPNYIYTGLLCLSNYTYRPPVSIQLYIQASFIKQV